MLLPSRAAKVEMESSVLRGLRLWLRSVLREHYLLAPIDMQSRHNAVCADDTVLAARQGNPLLLRDGSWPDLDIFKYSRAE